MTKEYKHIIIRRGNDIVADKWVYDVVTKKRTHAPLGTIEFYPAWKKFVFAPDDGCIFDESCLQDIISFLKDLK